MDFLENGFPEKNITLLFVFFLLKANIPQQTIEE